jgi:hypothetical protein
MLQEQGAEKTGGRAQLGSKRWARLTQAGTAWGGHHRLGATASIGMLQQVPWLESLALALRRCAAL